MKPLVRIELYGKSRKKRKAKKKKELPDKISQFQAELVKKITPAEQRFDKILKEAGFNYEFQKIFKTHAGYKIADFYLKDYGIAIEIDGGYHTDKNQSKEDKRREKALLGNSQIKKIVRFANEEVLETVPVEMLKRLIFYVCPEAEIVFTLLQ